MGTGRTFGESAARGITGVVDIEEGIPPDGIIVMGVPVDMAVGITIYGAGSTERQPAAMLSPPSAKAQTDFFHVMAYPHMRAQNPPSISVGEGQRGT